MKVWYGTLFGPRPTPSMCTHQAQPSFFFICRFFRDFGQKFSRPPVCLTSAYTGPTFSERRNKYPNYVLMQFGAKKNFENFTPKFKGKSRQMAILGPIFKRKKRFFNLLWDIIQDHRRCFEVQRTRLKRFLTSEPKWGLLRLETHLVRKIGFWG